MDSQRYHKNKILVFLDLTLTLIHILFELTHEFLHWFPLCKHLSYTVSFRLPFITIGAHRRKGTTDVQQSRKVKTIHIHSGFSMKHLKHDIALLHLERPVEMSDKVATVCLPNKNPNLNAKCYITGLFCFVITSNVIL